MDYTIIAILAAFALIAGIGFILNRRRNQAIEALAKKLGMRYAKQSNQTIGSFYQFKLFQKGHNQNIRNRMSRSENQVETSYFEYSYVTGHGKNSTTHTQSVVAVYNPEKKLPAFCMQPENVFSRVADKFRNEDIDFEDFPEFSKMFVLKGENEADIRALFSDPVIRFMEGNKGLSIEAKNSLLIVYRSGRCCSVKKMEPFILSALDAYTTLAKQ